MNSWFLLVEGACAFRFRYVTVAQLALPPDGLFPSSLFFFFPPFSKRSPCPFLYFSSGSLACWPRKTIPPAINPWPFACTNNRLKYDLSAEWLHAFSVQKSVSSRFLVSLFISFIREAQRCTCPRQPGNYISDWRETSVPRNKIYTKAGRLGKGPTRPAVIPPEWLVARAMLAPSFRGHLWWNRMKNFTPNQEPCKISPSNGFDHPPFTGCRCTVP